MLPKAENPIFLNSSLQKMTLRKLLSMLAGGAFLLALQCSAHAGAPPVNLEDAREALEKSSMVVIDIREPREHATGVAKGALLIPMGQLFRRLEELPKPAKQPFLVICHTQNRSSRMVEQLHAAGYSNASYVKGGMSQWAARGWPMVKP